jgi:hypothetical protein
VVAGSKAQTSTKDIPVMICTSRILTSTEQSQLTGNIIAIIDKQSRDKGGVADEIRRIINGTGMATSIH